jgi:putative membrane protein
LAAVDSAALVGAVSEAAALPADGDYDMKAETFFTEADKKKIAVAVRAVELKSAGEIAVMVVDRSDDYPEGQILAGGVIGCLSAMAATELFWAGNLWVFVVSALVLTVLCGWLVHYLPEVKRFFTPNDRLELQVQDRALTAFYEKGLYKTRDESGVLFFVSLFEHKVWVLADKGIYEKIRQETLQAYARDIAVGIKSGKAADMLCQSITAVGELLARHFPVKQDDVNELSDEVIIGQ